MGGPNNSFVWTMDANVIGSESVLNVVDIDASHGGSYICTVSNAAGAESASATLYVEPYIDTPLERETLAINGSNLNISCNAVGFPIPVVVWVDMQGIEVSNSSQLQFSPVLFGDEGLYRCVATSEIGETIFTAMSETTLVGKLASYLAKLHACLTQCYIIIIYSTVSPKASIDVAPLGIVANFGDNVTLTCTALGSPNTTFQWEKNGTIIGRDSVLYLPAIDVSYGGEYSCTVSNAAGTDTVSTTLYVAPYIVTPLEEQIPTRNGSIVNIHCDTAGFPTPNVNWLDMFEFEVSNTSQLQFSPIMFGNEGVYCCLASTVIDGMEYNSTDKTTVIGNCM